MLIGQNITECFCLTIWVINQGSKKRVHSCVSVTKTTHG